MIAVHADREHDLTEAFVALADTLVTGYDVIELLHDLAAAVTELLSADAAGILLADGHGNPQVMAYTSEEVRVLEQFGLRVEQGPGLDCFRTGAPLSVADLAGTDPGPAQRWPRFADHATAAGFRAAHAVPMRLRNEVIGALTLFDGTPAAMSAPDLTVAQALADVATIGILHERTLTAADDLNAQLQTALTSRILVEQAKGLLKERTGLSPEDSFELLRRYARPRHLRVTDVARDLLAGSITLGTVSGTDDQGPDGSQTPGRGRLAR